MHSILNPLDRPIWSALSQRQSAFAITSGRARRFISDVGVFAATPDDSPEALKDLSAIIHAHGPVCLLQTGDIPVPPRTAAASIMLGVQMVARNLNPLQPAAPLERLTADDVPAMLALTAATQPGPFFARTHEVGTFWGIKDNGRLVAMAGERMKIPGYTEVSAVCTYPEYRGRGYAALLSRTVATQILARGETPFLHAYASNAPAIRLYEALGFELRTNVNVMILTPAG